MKNLDIIFSDLINHGDFILLHSNTSRIYRAFRKHNPKFTIDNLLEYLLGLVGDNGTIMFPTFNFNFCDSKTFNINQTRSQMGVLTECARKHPDAIRTGHPIYSFVVIGKYAKQFNNLCNVSGYGNDSPFAKLLELNGKIAILDLPDQNSMTFYHYVEECCGVNYRYNKDFTASYININGNESKKTFKIYVRDIDKNVETYVNPMGEILWQKGIYKGSRPMQGHGLRVAKAQDIFNCTKDIILSGNALGNLYKIGD